MKKHNNKMTSTKAGILYLKSWDKNPLVRMFEVVLVNKKQGITEKYFWGNDYNIVNTHYKYLKSLINDLWN